MIPLRKVIISVALFASLLITPNVFADNEILNIRHWAATDHTRIVIDTSDEPDYTLDKTSRKLIIDFRNAKTVKNLPRKLTLRKPGIGKIMVSSRADQIVHVEIFLPDNVETKVFKLKKFQNKPDRVVIDIELPEVELQESRSREQIKGQTKSRIIVIDPGHGGDDPGAIGKDGTREKAVVLSISRKLRDVLNKKEGYRAFLTRKGDYYVSFKKRLTIAREYGADLFVSIHADAFRGRSARGSSVYCLSLRSASSEAAKILAGQENLSDTVGGVPDSEKSDESDPIVLNMFQTNTINLSKAFGNQVLKHLSDIGNIKHNIVQEAPFRVLKLPDIPSLLIETAFISNPAEEHLLKTSRFQSKLANTIAEAIVDFRPGQQSERRKVIVTKNESPNKAPHNSQNKNQTSAPAYYKVRRGDTLAIVARKYETTIGTLLRINNMKINDPLYVGKKLRLTDPKKESAHKEITKRTVGKGKTKIIHIVKRGDTLSNIARNYNISIGELTKNNKLEPDAPLFVGRKLKIPEATALRETRKEETPPQTKKDTWNKEPQTYIYKVRKGDTILIVARRCDTTLGELLELNNLRLTDALYVDQELIVRKEPSD